MIKKGKKMILTLRQKVIDNPIPTSLIYTDVLLFVDTVHEI